MVDGATFDAECARSGTVQWHFEEHRVRVCFAVVIIPVGRPDIHRFLRNVEYASRGTEHGGAFARHIAGREVADSHGVQGRR